MVPATTSAAWHLVVTIQWSLHSIGLPRRKGVRLTTRRGVQPASCESFRSTRRVCPLSSLITSAYLVCWVELRQTTFGSLVILDLHISSDARTVLLRPLHCCVQSVTFNAKSLNSVSFLPLSRAGFESSVSLFLRVS